MKTLKIGLKASNATLYHDRKILAMQLSLLYYQTKQSNSSKIWAERCLEYCEIDPRVDLDESEGFVKGTVLMTLAKLELVIQLFALINWIGMC